MDGKVYLSNKELAQYLGVSPMSIWRYQKDPALKFPQPAALGNLKRTDVRKVDAWMARRSRRTAA